MQQQPEKARPTKSFKQNAPKGSTTPNTLPNTDATKALISEYKKNHAGYEHAQRPLHGYLIRGTMLDPEDVR